MDMKVMKGVYVLALLSLFIACDDDDDNNDNNNNLETTDEQFVEGAALSNMTEIEFGNLAATQGESDMVRAYGQQMVSEHTTAQQELQSLANNFDNVDWPENLDQQHQQLRQQLMEMSGWQFDSAYIASQVMDHEKTLELFDSEISGGKNESIKNYANKYRPHIEHHLEKADSILNVLLQPIEDN